MSPSIIKRLRRDRWAEGASIITSDQQRQSKKIKGDGEFRHICIFSSIHNDE